MFKQPSNDTHGTIGRVQQRLVSSSTCDTPHRSARNRLRKILVAMKPGVISVRPRRRFLAASPSRGWGGGRGGAAKADLQRRLLFTSWCADCQTWQVLLPFGLRLTRFLSSFPSQRQDRPPVSCTAAFGVRPPVASTARCTSEGSLDLCSRAQGPQSLIA